MHIEGFDRIFAIDTDHLSMEYLMNLVVRSNGDKEIEGIFYLLPDFSLKDGLGKMDGENEVINLYDTVIQNRVVNVYVFHKYPIPSKHVPPNCENISFAFELLSRIEQLHPLIFT